jgi:DNA-binding beta-propeller fold protein YncE
MRKGLSFAVLCAVGAVACAPTATPSPSPDPTGKSGDCIPSATVSATASSTPLEHRAYVISRDSDDLTVIDLDRLEILGTARPCGEGDHMAELNADFSKIYVDSPGTHESIVLDARTLQVQKRILVGAEPTHLSLSKDGKLMAIVNEYDDSVSFVDPVKDVEIKRVDGFFTPHFVRFAPDGKYAYVANIGAHHITRVDLETLTIDGHIVLDGFDGPPRPTPAKDESGFADVQIDKDGVLFAAHASTGRVLVYDTKTRTKVREIAVGASPWIVYAEHPFPQITRHVVPNFGDQTVSLIAREPTSVPVTVGGADKQSFGVNYSPLVPNRAFVMNRFKNEIAILDTESGKRVGQIPVGGTTETGATTADGKYIVAAVSSANRIVVIDAVASVVIKTFENVGKYPWSVTIPMGQNYCH